VVGNNEKPYGGGYSGQRARRAANMALPFADASQWLIPGVIGQPIGLKLRFSL